MKIAILGASGLVGSHVYDVAGKAGHTVLGTYRHFPVPGLTGLDLSDETVSFPALKAFLPEAIFYCAGWSWVDGCEREPERAFFENRDLPLKYGKLARELGAHFTYISSSYVFDGETGPYDERALPQPLSVYGKSKSAGETALRQMGSKGLVIARTHGVYGLEAQGKNFVYQVVKSLTAGRTIRVPNDQFGNATYAGDMAHWLVKLVECGQEGIWNVSGNDPMLRRDNFAIQIAQTFGLSQDLILPVPSVELKQAAPRPRLGGLLIEKGAAFFRQPPRSLNQALSELKERF